MERLPVLFKRMRDAREKQRNGTFTEEIGTILVAVLFQYIEEAWHKSIYLCRDAAWACHPWWMVEGRRYLLPSAPLTHRSMPPLVDGRR